MTLSPPSIEGVGPDMVLLDLFWKKGTVVSWMAWSDCFCDKLFGGEMYPYCDLSFFNLLGTRDIPPFGSAENSSVGGE